MVTVATVKQYLKNSTSQRKVALGALYNYLSCFHSSEVQFTTEVVNSFFRRSLKFPYWQENRDILSGEVGEFLTKSPLLKREPIDFTATLNVKDLQLITLKRPEDAVEVIHRYLIPALGQSEQLRVLKHDKTKVLALRLDHGGNLSVTSFSYIMILLNGVLEPLVALDSLHYDPQMEFQKGVDQTVEISPFVVARFQSSVHLQGALIRGYTFQRYESFSTLKLSQNTHLFYALKRLEQSYVRKESDPIYHELIDYLEQAIQHVRNSPSFDLRRGHEVLNRARMALENIFPGDKTLVLLIRTLDDSLKLQERESYHEVEPL